MTRWFLKISREMSRVLWFAILVSSGYSSADAQDVAQSGQRQAESMADRIVERFYETLDFEQVYREFYVSGRLRNAEVEIIVNNFASGPPSRSQGKARIDFAAKERAYLALANFRWLSSAVNRTYDGDQTQLKKEAEQALILYYEPLNNKATWPILTSEQLDARITSRLDKLAAFFRGKVVKKNFGTEAYKTKLSEIEETQQPETPNELKDLFAFAGMPQNAQIYVVRRERFYIYLVEQDGGFKMLSFTDRIRS